MTITSIISAGFIWIGIMMSLIGVAMIIMIAGGKQRGDKNN